MRLETQQARKVLGNKPADFEEVVHLYYERVFNLTYRLMGDEEEAKDMTQETFLHAFQAYDSFRGDCQVFTWLYRIAVNLCKNRLRHLQRRRSVEAELVEGGDGEEDDEGQVREIEDVRFEPERVFEQKELAEVIQKRINALPEEQRTVVVLRDIEGLSYEQVAKIVGCSLEAVKSRLFRARSNLRKWLSPYLEGREGSQNRTGKRFVKI